MPAFGKFTGLYLVKKEYNSNIYVVINDAVVGI
jgi:hypothetical protein